MIDGFEPGQDGFVLSANNRQAVKEWLISEGIDPARVEGMRSDNLWKAYRHPAYLQQMKRRADYYLPLRYKEENTKCAPIRSDNSPPKPATPLPTTRTVDTCSNTSNGSADGSRITIDPPCSASISRSAAAELLELAIRELIAEAVGHLIDERIDARLAKLREK